MSLVHVIPFEKWQTCKFSDGSYYVAVWLLWLYSSLIILGNTWWQDNAAITKMSKKYPKFLLKQLRFVTMRFALRGELFNPALLLLC